MQHLHYDLLPSRHGLRSHGHPPPMLPWGVLRRLGSCATDVSCSSHGVHDEHSGSCCSEAPRMIRFVSALSKTPPVKFSRDPSAIGRGAGEYAFLAGRLPSDGTDGADTQPL